MKLNTQQTRDHHKAFHTQGMRDRNCRVCQIGQGAHNGNYYLPYLATEIERETMQAVMNRYHTS